MKNVYEIAYLKSENDVRSRVYEDVNKFKTDFQVIANSGKPCMAQGPDKNGELTVVRRNGWDGEDYVLTAEVNFGSGRKYLYTASRHYMGLYEVETKFGKSIVHVNYRWRQIDDFYAEIWSADYDYATSFESILIRKVVN